MATNRIVFFDPVEPSEALGMVYGTYLSGGVFAGNRAVTALGARALPPQWSRCATLDGLETVFVGDVVLQWPRYCVGVCATTLSSGFTL